MGGGDLPAWMICQEILVKVKNELVLQAIDLLHEQEERKRIEVNAKLITPPDKSSEVERDMFVIGKLIEEEPRIRERYAGYVKEIEQADSPSPETLERMEELEKFLMALTQISVTMGFVKVFDGWFNGLETGMKLDDLSEVIYRTAVISPERISALEFVIGNKNFVKHEALTKDELAVLKGAYERCRRENANEVKG